MAKKADETEIKKECPSCGLGVALDMKMCEFCGWDFDEEDEWILQIEKLERDLLLEKQKFEPGSVENRIESTLRSPFFQKTGESGVVSPPKPIAKFPAPPAPKPQMKVPASTGPAIRETKASGVMVVKPVDTREEPKPVVRTTGRAPAPAVVEPLKPAPAPARPAAPALAGPAMVSDESRAQAPKTRKTRVVRKVKQA